MVNKGEKPTETTLARGRILPAELHRVLHQAGADATFLFIRVVWRGEHDATMTDLEDLDPIEDAEKVFSVYGRFDFEDGSSLTLKLQDYRQPSFASATGQTARARLALIGQTWSQIPGRAKITRSWDFLPWVVAFGCVSGAAF